MKEEVMTISSYCKKCNGLVRTCVKHKMSNESKAEFYTEVVEHDLDTKEQRLDDFIKEKSNFCKC